MKDLVRKHLSHLKSSKKSQVTSIDVVIAYLVFSLFLIQVAMYITNISNPFTSYIAAEDLFKNGESIKAYFSTAKLSAAELEHFCSQVLPNVLNSSASYDLKGLMMPFYDSPANESRLGVNIKRTGNTIRLSFNTNEPATLFEIILPTSAEVEVDMVGTESFDYYNKTRVSSNYVVTFFANNTGSDTDSFDVTVNDTILVLFNPYFTNTSEVFAGDVPFHYS